MTRPAARPVDKPALQSPSRDGSISETSCIEERDATTLPRGTVDPIYEAKIKVLNHAIQEIGMGRYQWQLFIVVGFGWANDNLWPVITSLILTPITNEFKPKYPPLLTLAQAIGLLAGAVFWGFSCDVFGRKLAFNLTLGITAVFGILAPSSPSFAVLGFFVSAWSFGVGGNLPVDSAVFLEFLPGSHQYLLTILSVYWALAGVLANLVAWPLLGSLTCQQKETCDRSKNLGWRFFILILGGVATLQFLARFLFRVHESPKFLIGKRREAEAVAIIHDVARRNGKTSTLTVEHLRACGNLDDITDESHIRLTFRRQLEKFDLSHVKALFANKRLAYSTTLIMLTWAFIGLGFPLYSAFIPYLQATRGAQFGDGSTNITYRNSLIVAIVGIPAALLGAYLVEVKSLGRRGTLAASTALVAVVLLSSTTARTSSALLGWQCAFNFFSNIMYAVLYSFTPELFFAKSRGTGNSLTAMSNRIFGLMSPLIAIYANLKTSVPVYISGAVFLAASICVMLLPFESRGKASL